LSTRHLPEFDYFEPKTLEEAIELLSKYGNDAKVLAGGTDLLVDMRLQEMAPKKVVNIQRIPNLNYIKPDEEGVKIGALTTIRELETSMLLKKGAYIVLAEAAHKMGSIQIRNMATIGGNICHALPSADTPPALVALDARVKIIGPTGERVVPLEEIFVNVGKTALTSGELLTEIQVRNPPAHSGTAFFKIGRTAMDLAIVNVAVRITLLNKVCKETRIVIGGGVGPTLIRSKRAEALLNGKKMEEAIIEKAAQVASEELKPRPTSIRGSPFYKVEVSKVLVRRALKKALDRVGG